MELLATVDWLVEKQRIEPDSVATITGHRGWPGGQAAGQRKLRIFEERLIGLALDQLGTAYYSTSRRPEMPSLYWRSS